MNRYTFIKGFVLAVPICPCLAYFFNRECIPEYTAVWEIFIEWPEIAEGERTMKIKPLFNYGKDE